MFDPKCMGPVPGGRAEKRVDHPGQHAGRNAWAGVALATWLFMQFWLGAAVVAQGPISAVQATATSQQKQQPAPLPPRVIEAQRFLAQRGLTPGHRVVARPSAAGRSSPHFSQTHC
jgi:hypothetical protein